MERVIHEMKVSLSPSHRMMHKEPAGNTRFLLQERDPITLETFSMKLRL